MMNPNPHRQIKYTHVLSREKIEEFIHLTAEDRLNWLEEANEFVNTFVDPEARRIWREMNKRRVSKDPGQEREVPNESMGEVMIDPSTGSG